MNLSEEEVDTTNRMEERIASLEQDRSAYMGQHKRDQAYMRELEQSILEQNGSEVNTRLVRMNCEWNNMKDERDRYRVALYELATEVGYIPGGGHAALWYSLKAAKRLLDGECQGRSANP